jgi:hypothetical protein
MCFCPFPNIFIGRSWWLRLWTGNDEQHTSMIHSFNYSFQAHDLSPFRSPSNAPLFTTSGRPDAPGYSPDNLRYYLGVYILFSVTSAVLGTIRYWYIYTGSIRASRRLFDKLCFTILRTPLRWMDTVPLGRILNRFTADFNVVDGRLANDISFGAHNFFRLLGVIVAGCVRSIPLSTSHMTNPLFLQQSLRISLRYRPLSHTTSHLRPNSSHVLNRCPRSKALRK